MKENEQYKILSLLRSKIPEFEENYNDIYLQDPVFKEIIKEYYICVRKQEMIIKETGEKDESYEDTIRELKDELLDYIRNMRPDEEFEIQ